MENVSIFYLRNIHWKDVVKNIWKADKETLENDITIQPVSENPDLKNYLVVSLSKRADKLLQKFRAHKIENSGLRSRIPTIPYPVFGRKENLDLLR